MSLADRLSQARLTAVAEAPSEAETAFSTPQRRTRQRNVDPFAALKQRVHETLLEQLGRSLYDAKTSQEQLERLVRQSLQTVLESESAPLTVADRARVAQEIADDILGYGPLEPYLRDPDITEVMVNGPQQIYVERDGVIHAVDGMFNDDAHLRRTIDKIVGEGRPAHRRGAADGRRAPVGRQPGERGHPPGRHRRAEHHHPQVRRRPVQRRGPRRPSGP